MKLDQLTIEIRPRRPWEAVDLGVRMAQRWWWPLTLIFVILSLPVWLLLEIIPLEEWFYKPLLFWLLLPLFERPLLHFLSKAVFNEVLSVKQTLKAAPRLFLQQVILSLTWRRLSPSRSMDVSVVVLENLKGGQRASRISTLHREDASPAAWLSFISHFCVYAIALTFFIVILQFISHFFDTPWWQFIDDDSMYPFFSRWSGIMFYHLLYIGFVLVTPFYVASGFALYLNRRIKLEAWDVEIAFRKIVQKREHSQANMQKTIVVSLMLFFCSLFSAVVPPNVNAEIDNQEAVYPGKIIFESQQPSEEELGEIKGAKNEIEKILESEDFNRKEIDKEWHFPVDFDWDFEGDENDSKIDKALRNLFLSIVAGMANWGEIILWVCVLCLIFYLIYRYRHWFAELTYNKTAQKKIPPQTLFGLAITEESLPDDIGAAALGFWQEGRHRDALALLYRACLAQLVIRGLELEDGDTELECLYATKHKAGFLKLGDNTLEYFKTLTEQWRKLAYGHIIPESNIAITLCSGWAPTWRPPLPLEQK